MIPKFLKDNNIQLIWKHQSSIMNICGKFMGGDGGKFMTLYATTIGRKIYMPKTWWDNATDKQRMILLRHELVHVNQMKRYSVPVFLLLYLFIPLPAGLSYFRAKFEKDGYEETLRARYEYWGKDSITSSECRYWVTQQFLGSAYGWMWPFKRSINNWYDKTLQEIIENK